MTTRSRKGSLSADEKKIVKALLAKQWRNQDIQALVNIGRDATINSARITEVKGNSGQVAASDDAVEFYQIRKKAYDHKTGLNVFDDERIIRAREAMVLAVQVFNSASMNFKTEVFTMLSNVAWTYLLHEYYERKGVPIIGEDGRSLLLSQMIDREGSPLSQGIRQNLKSLKILRDDVEHKLLGRADVKWLGLFQANCLNFDKVMCDIFGEELTLSHELSFALQFSRLNIEQLATLNRYEVPPHIDAVDARLLEGLTEQDQADLEYQFRVVYTLDSVTKARAQFQFVRPDSSEGQEIKNVLVKHKLSDHLYPYKPMEVIKLVCEKSGKEFSQHNHTQGWRKFEVRPKSNATQPENTKQDYCIFHPAHGDYTYSEAWVDLLVSEVEDDNKFALLKAIKL